MIVYECEQGSPEWLHLRCGIPTASRFDEIVTPKTMKPSASAFPYMCELLAERMLGEPYAGDGTQTGYIRRGREMEAKALAWYTLTQGRAVRRVGLCLHDEHIAGCSPDGLIGDDGGIEAKVPGAKKHVAYMIRPDSLVADYRHQVQGGLYVTGRHWWDLIAYHPSLEPVVVRVEPEPDYQAALDLGIRQLNADIETYLIQFGYVQTETKAA